ncbi:endo-1,4-beta-xylanase [Pseudoroseomonas globiformis]|uniref:Beta-xylanase n=1 Tax=Teichococcus globiformis TaxID=2307229 RepID=A0ABV7FU67_9PROT
MRLSRRQLAAALAGGTLPMAGLPASGLAQTAGRSLSPTQGLGAIARAHGITFGTAVQQALLAEDPRYAAAVAAEAALLVPEWEAKWEALQPEEGRFDTAPLDGILLWARERRLPVRGHALIWHRAMPGWLVAALGEGAPRARRLIGAHFDRVLAHASGQIRDWDVVNEVIANPPGSDVPDPGSGPLRDSPWLRALGPSYIETALRMARERDPTLRLTLNEYGIEEATPDADEKRRRLVGVLRGLLDRGVPLDAVGIQAHLQMVRPFRPEPFAAFLAELRAMGLGILITELDIREAPDAPAELQRRDALVAGRAADFLRCAVEGGARTVLSWGLSDRHSWLATDPDVALGRGRTHRGLPLDAEWQRKPVWSAMARTFSEA